ncbi:MAG TPA: cytochrome P450 [Solirubrobacterales bacterium]|nr:cytochrome P450 [Solirubrobacterales bacterium]
MSDNGLGQFRERLDPIDEEISRLLGERFEICREVAEYKSEHGIPMMQPERVAEVCARYLARGAAAGLPEDFSAELFELLIGATCKLEDELMGEEADPGDPAQGGLPPGPEEPEMVQSMRWAREPLPMLEECRERYGDTFTLRLRHLGTWVVLSDPEDVKRVFSTDTNDLGVGVPNLALKPVLGAHSVMLSEEPQHMVQRKLMLPRFHGERMREDAETMTELARREVRSWPVGEPFELWPRMQALTQEVVMRAVFGDDEGRLDRLRALLTNLTETINDDDRLWKLALFGPEWLEDSREWREAMEPVEEEVLAEARRRRAAGENGRRDAVSILVDARHEDGSPLSEKELRDELLTLLTDGPTSSSLAWVFERLLRHPDKLAQLQEELLTGEGDAYLDAVIKETLRLRPPVSVVVRRLLKPATLGGYDLPAGTLIAPCVYLIHHRADVYENPGEFVPERFLERRAAVPTWIPFGGGARRCLAASYAEQEMKRVVRTVLEEVELEPVDSGSEQISRAAIAFSPAQHGLVVARPRTPAYA